MIRAAVPAAALLAGALLLGAAVAEASAAPQKRAPELPEIDPYTEEDPDVMAAAGIVRYGGFLVDGAHLTTEVEEVLGIKSLRWLETEHFRIGCALPPYKPQSMQEKKKVRAELEVLSERLKGVKPKTRIVDPWLRLHLVALRAEAFYAAFLEQTGMTDADFPKAGGDNQEGEWMGQGPYLGQKGKFVLLFTTKASTFSRFCRRFARDVEDTPLRHMYPEPGILLYGCAMEHLGVRDDADTALHAFMGWNLAQVFSDAFKSFTHRLPPWFTEAYAHWTGRGVDERCSNHTPGAGPPIRWKSDTNWAPKVRARVHHKVFPSFQDQIDARDVGEFDFNDHMFLWSRMEFLMQREGTGLGTYLRMMKGRIPGSISVPSTDILFRRQREVVFPAAWGSTVEELDAEWQEWVLETYPKK